MRGLAKLILLGAFAMLGVSAPLSAQIEGQYEQVGALPSKNSLDTVRFEEFLNFTCPHCSNFVADSKPLFRKYAGKLEIINIPILFRGQSDLPIRLFYIAQRAGREHEMKQMLFDATFKYGVNINDPAVIQYLARSAGLSKEYDESVNAEWVAQKVSGSLARANAATVEATPTIVLQGALKVESHGRQATISTLDNLISQLLKKQS